MTLTNFGTTLVLVLDGKPLHTDLQPLGVRARTPTLALNIGHFVTGRPGIDLQQGERALWEKAPGGAITCMENTANV